MKWKNDNEQILYDKLMNNDNTPYEALNIKMCKQSMRVPRRVSNLAARAELGRLPLRHHIIVAQMKYFLRVNFLNQDDLLRHAFISQERQIRNSYNTLTYIQSSKILTENLGLQHVNHNLLAGPYKVSKCLKKYSCRVKEASFKCFQSLFSDKINSWLINYTKLALYASIKRNFKYEKYLDAGCQNIPEFTKFRMSTHWLPIERGRYTKPKTPRENRLCYYCKSHIGTEFHVLMECDYILLKDLRDEYMFKITKIFPMFHNWSSKTIFQYMMLGLDINLTRLFANWISQCNKLNKAKCKTI